MAMLLRRWDPNSTARHAIGFDLRFAVVETKNPLPRHCSNGSSTTDRSYETGRT
jgi:hypothetical protein